MKKLMCLNKSIIWIILFLFVLIGCEETSEKQQPCNHTSCTWVWEEDASCGVDCIMYHRCDECGMDIDIKIEYKEHEYTYETAEPTCTEKGYTITRCANCNYQSKKVTEASGHNYQYVIDQEATSTNYGLKHMECLNCHQKEAGFAYACNDFSTHGALHVTGVNLMDSNNQKMRLAGISTFGLQWAPQYVNYSTFENLKNSFGINVIRLALYTAEGGYCTGGEAKKESMYQTLVNGIEYATQLNMYVIVDWHMLGADEKHIGDENPLYFKDEAVEFFDKVTKQFKDHDNILFEIMNEPSGDTTWADCKTYAKAVIPAIRKNMPNAVILVGNPLWTSDLASVAKDKLTYPNIMYAFHFYAGDNTLTNKITTAVETDKLPVFVTEHGAMDADGYGELDYTSIEKWYKVLDKYNISFVAWSLCNLSSSSSMFKTTTKTLDDFSDDLLKEWGVYYKKRVRTVMGLPIEEE